MSDVALAAASTSAQPAPESAPAERPCLLRTIGLSIAITPYPDSFGQAFEAAVAYACAETRQRGFATIRQAWAWCEQQTPKIMGLAR